MRLTAGERRKVKRLRHWLVAHGNCVVMLGTFAPGSANRAIVERERKKIWGRLMKADARPLKAAADELNDREMRWTADRQR